MTDHRPVLNSPTPPFFRSEGTDQLMHMVLALAAELSAVTEELDTLRRVIVQKGAVSAADLAGYAPDAEALAARAARRDELVRAMFAALERESEALARAAGARG